MVDYLSLIERRVRLADGNGFEPVYMPDAAMDFQRYLIDWSVRYGRSALFADCGMGKTLMQLAWAENVVRKTNGSVLIATPLAVAQQTAREAEKFGIEAAVSRDGNHGKGITVTNYEKLHLFDSANFEGFVCDESSAIKDFKSARTSNVYDFARTLKYRLLCTATAAPNDFFELGTSSEALGYMGFRDMITTFFVQETQKDRLGWGRTKYRFRGHAQKPFWRWVAGWARAIRKPSDYGFDDAQFQLPALNEHECVVENSTPRDGMLFATPAVGMREEREERRVTINERCELAARLIDHDRPAVAWCQLNPEADLLEKLIPDAVQVSGSDSDDAKEEKFAAFQSGEIRVIVTKPKIGAWGLNWQHCSDVVTFPSHSFEQYYQAVRRCWRFGQTRTVDVHVIATEGERGVVANLKRKSEQADEMFHELVASMTNAIDVRKDHSFKVQEELPQWL